MNSKEYQERAMSRRMPGTRESELVLASLGLVREASEAIEHVQRELFFSTPIDPEKVLEEVGDTIWYATLLLHTLGYTLENAMDANDAKLEKRYQGGGFTYEKWKADRVARGLMAAETAEGVATQPLPEWVQLHLQGPAAVYEASHGSASAEEPAPVSADGLIMPQEYDAPILTQLELFR